METITLSPGRRRGTVEVPWSKSHLHRVLLAQFLAGGPVPGDQDTLPDDVLATQRCLRALSSPRPCLDCGESGSTLRFLLPVSMVLRDSVDFTATGRLPQRPLAPLLKQLKQHGVICSGDHLPLHLQGSLTGGDFTLPGDVSSQFITGLLFALPLLPQDSRIQLTTPLASAGYVQMTQKVLQAFGIQIDWIDSRLLIPGNQKYCLPETILPERDWSGAAPWIVMNHLGSQIQFGELPTDSFQPDRMVGNLLASLGGELCLAPCPDLFPVLAIAAGAWQGTTTFTGIRRLRFKESDRLAAMADLLERFGVPTENREDTFLVHGIGAHFRGNLSLPTCGDHRIAIAAAVGATIADGPVTIQNPQCVRKSYPDFFVQLAALSPVSPSFFP